MASSARNVSFVAVLSNIPNLRKCLQNLLPNITFKDVNCDSEDSTKNLHNAEIVVADFDLLIPHLYKLNAKWVQGTWAGVENLMKGLDLTKPLPEFPMTRFSGPFFGLAMGEYVVSNIINWERNFRDIVIAQKNSHWQKEERFSTYRTISEMTIGILGLGTIGKDVSKILKTFEGRIWALARNIPSDTEKLPYIDEYKHISKLSEFLENCDYIVSLMPATPETDGFLDGDVLKSCSSKKSIIINAGRGNIIKEETVVKAIREGWISGAILDVFQEEPLPKTSLLWTIPEVLITPHIAAVTTPGPVAQLFLENLERFISNQPLKYQIDFSKGY